jgi:3-oxoacyl-[acyl-carrier protein] reductase
MRKLDGKVAVITGASKGIGASIAEHLAAEGSSVVINYATSHSGADDVARRIVSKGGKAVVVQADMSQLSDIERLFARTRESFGKLDILVNNAGVFQFAPLDAVTPEHIRRQFEVNVFGLLLTTQAAVRFMSPQGGSVINISSIVGSMPSANASAYSATKAAVDAITISLSQELGPRAIRVNSLSPGMVETEGLRAAGLDQGEFREQQNRNTPLGRIAKPDDIALAATFLASDDARWITGQIIVAAGGMRL